MTRENRNTLPFSQPRPSTGTGRPPGGSSPNGNSFTLSSTPSHPYKPIDGNGRLTGVKKRIGKKDLKKEGTKTKPRPRKVKTEPPDGYDPNNKFDGRIPPGFDNEEHQRGHLLGHLLGGSNYDPGNFVSLHTRVNNPHMKAIEEAVYKKIKEEGKTVDYEVFVNYDGDAYVPSSIRIVARSTDGTFSLDEKLPNSPDIDSMRDLYKP
jgi:hypothetical protein